MLPVGTIFLFFIISDVKKICMLKVQHQMWLIIEEGIQEHCDKSYLIANHLFTSIEGDLHIGKYLSSFSDVSSAI